MEFSGAVESCHLSSRLAFFTEVSAIKSEGSTAPLFGGNFSFSVGIETLAKSVFLFLTDGDSEEREEVMGFLPCLVQCSLLSDTT